MEHAEIHNRAGGCLSEFDSLLLVQPTPDRDHDEYQFNSEDQKARFSIWSANLGVFADKHASLDYRLRDNEEAKDLMLTLLKTLKDYIQRAIHAAESSSSDDGFSSSFTSTEGSFSSNDGSRHLPSISSSLTASSIRDTATDDSMSISAESDRTPFEQRLHGIEQTIDQLYRLGVAIRRPSIISQNVKAANFPIKDEDGNDISEEFAGFISELISHQFQEAPSFLRDRLAKSVTLRRKRFLYRQSHQKKLGMRVTLTPQPSGTYKSHALGTDADRTVIAATIIGNPAIKVSTLQDGRLKSNSHSQTSASIVSVKFKADDITGQRAPTAAASTMFTRYTHDDSSNAIPDPPKPAAGAKEFECPYCCMMLPMKEATRSQWVRHVLSDLEPYVCVFEDCSDAHRLFRDRAAWLSHMQETHSKQWTCRAAGHKPRAFDTEQDFEIHMRSDHANGFKESQLSWHKKRSVGPAAGLFSECPLCGYVPSEENVNTIINGTGLQITQKHERCRAVSESIVKHLVEHLKTISMRALPWQEEVQEESSKNGASKEVEEDVESNVDVASHLTSEKSSLITFDEAPTHVQENEWHIDPAVVNCGIALKSIATNESFENEWGFIRQSSHYSLDRDPILQKFLKRLYLESSSVTERHKSIVLPIHMMPPTPLNKNFFGRKHVLKAIAAQLVPEEDAADDDSKVVTYPLTYAICAPGGMGKTQLAIQFAIAHQKSFDVILWINADSVNEMDQGFQRIAVLLGLISEDSIDVNDLVHTREIVKRWLVSPPAPKNDKSRKHISWLLIYDGVQDPDILNKYWPYDGPGSILITSRNPFSWTNYHALKQFTSEEAISFILRLTNRKISEVDRESITKVGSRLGGLPLALTQMASIIVTKNLSFRQFLDAYNERDSQRELLQFQSQQLNHRPSRDEHTVASVWAFENLKFGRKLLNVLSMLDPDSIPERLLISAGDSINLTGYPTTVEEYELAKAELLACSLVTGNKREKKLFVHRLIQDVARAEMGQAEFRQTFITCVKLVASTWPFEDFTWRHGIARWSLCEEVFPHVARLKDIFPAFHSSAQTPDDYNFARLLTDAGWYLHERGRLIDTNLYNNMAQSICESLKYQLSSEPLSPSPVGVTHAKLDYTLSELYHNRGVIACGASDAVEGLGYLQIFHNMMEREFKEDTPRTDMRLGLACSQLGFAYMHMEDWKQGEIYFLRSIELLKRLDTFEPILISLPLVNLGYAYWLQGRLEEAAELLEQGVSDREEKYGTVNLVSFISGRFYHALGNVTFDQGLLEESLSYHHKALLHFKATLGNNHHLTASVFVKVAEHNIRVGQYDTALALLDHALKAYSMANSYLSEKARVTFKRSKALRCLRRVEEADRELKLCFMGYQERVLKRIRVTGIERVVKKRAEDLVDADFDDLVAFWFK